MAGEVWGGESVGASVIIGARNRSASRPRVVQRFPFLGSCVTDCIDQTPLMAGPCPAKKGKRHQGVGTTQHQNALAVVVSGLLNLGGVIRRTRK